MTTTLYYFPGQKATVFLETKDGYGQRADVGLPFDGYVDPIITRVIFPDLSLAANFPQPMIKLDTGLYFFQFTLPVGGASVGSYLVDVTYNPPGTTTFLQTFFQLIVTAPFGNFGVTTFGV
jgi:hypothetical protein